ncbi:Uncharacterised protein [Mycobacteroides abscessus subsp. abscessus]|nr:Uncharacterised protein [Mycobacteroides abscessus subsp. abscessus]
MVDGFLQEIFILAVKLLLLMIFNGKALYNGHSLDTFMQISLNLGQRL